MRKADFHMVGPLRIDLEKTQEMLNGGGFNILCIGYR